MAVCLEMRYVVATENDVTGTPSGVKRNWRSWPTRPIRLILCSMLDPLINIMESFRNV